jgi:hypothetical protein
LHRITDWINLQVYSKEPVLGGRIFVQISITEPQKQGKAETPQANLQAQLPGLKRLPFENIRTAVDRIIAKMDLGELDLHPDFERVSYMEEPDTERNYPGITSICQVHFVTAIVECNDTDILNNFGLPEGFPYSFEDPDGTSIEIDWLTEEAAAQLMRAGDFQA